jgi:YHS domain-containing protein
MKKASRILLVLGFIVLVGFSLVGKDIAFTAQEENCYSNLGNRVICPITGSAFNITKESEKLVYEGKVYYFCCPGCKVPFEKNPEKYLK